MTQQAPRPVHVPELYTPAQVAKALDCSEWWVKEQARRRRIPFTWIGGSYKFTAEHVKEIIRLFESRPGTATGATGTRRAAPRRLRPRTTQPTTLLQARTPRRALRATPPPAED